MSHSGDNRLETFESDNEHVIVIVGDSEVEHRTIHNERVEGRFAIVPVDALEAEHGAAEIDPDELRLDEMQLVDDVVPVRETGDADVELCRDGEQVVRMDRAGCYGLLWVPII